eukprot:GHVN01050484.1.p1 GENE.GHVN01050484.1~~GHVN01050484.1.p1  ORF type:complete len:111 (+),score=8.04 GHVN01050484.1:107-439(+)
MLGRRQTNSSPLDAEAHTETRGVNQPKLTKWMQEQGITHRRCGSGGFIIVSNNPPQRVKPPSSSRAPPTQRPKPLETRNFGGSSESTCGPSVAVQTTEEWVDVLRSVQEE